METVKIDPWLVTGLAERAGSFTYSRSGIALTLYFAIKLPETESPLLDALRDYFGGGGNTYRVPARGEHARPSSYLRFCRQADLERIVRHFERHPLRGPRKEAFAVWREMVELKGAGGRNQPWDRLHGLADRLSEATKAPGAKSARSDASR